MNRTQRQPRKALRSRSVIAGSLLALFLFVLAMAQFETLHESCHAEAKQADHQCAVTTLHSGMVDASATDTAIVPAPPVVVSEPITGISFVSSADYSLLPSRGPPAPLA